MKVYLVEGYNLITGQQGIAEYIEASNESEACRKFEQNNYECEANEILMEMDKKEFEEMFKDFFEEN